jgi:hypothetical protein
MSSYALGSRNLVRLLVYYVVGQNWQHIKMIIVGTFVRASAVANISLTAIGILMELGIWVPGTIPQNPPFFKIFF